MKTIEISNSFYEYLYSCGSCGSREERETMNQQNSGRTFEVGRYTHPRSCDCDWCEEKRHFSEDWNAHFSNTLDKKGWPVLAIHLAELASQIQKKEISQCGQIKVINATDAEKK